MEKQKNAVGRRKEAVTRVFLSKGDGKITLSWDATFKLLKADKVNGPYSEVSGATSPKDVPTLGVAEAYYKLSN